MRYTLGELLADKELRKSLIEDTFYFTDENGEFFAVDFENESMRQNHITVFEVLYTLGGDELFEKLLAEGKTCLTKDSKAAKIGVQPISGAEGWYLKTNASAVAAFSSILNGLAGLENDERFYFGPQDTSTSTHFVSNSEHGYSTYFYSEGFETQVEKREDGRFVIKNIDENQVISFSVQENQDTPIEFDSFYALEPLFKKEEVFTDESWESEYVDVAFAYKYKLDENGKWGYFNLAFTQVIPPNFEDVVLTENEDRTRLIAWEQQGFLGETDFFFYFESMGKVMENETELNVTHAYKTNYEGSPSGSAYVDRCYNFEDGTEVFCYVPQKNLGVGFVFLPGEGRKDFNSFSALTTEGYFVKIHDGVLEGEKTNRKLAVEGDVIYAFDCKKLYCGEAQEHQVAYRLIEDGYYAVERDAYYAIAKFKKTKEQFPVSFSNELEFVELLTPYAFTDINCNSGEGYAIVERFGKQGLFNLNTKKYVLPCDYDRIGILHNNEYRIRKVDFYGMVSVRDGQVKWTEHLHREE